MSSLNVKKGTMIALLFCSVTNAEAFTGPELAAFAVASNVHASYMSSGATAVPIVVARGPEYPIAMGTSIVSVTQQLVAPTVVQYNITK